MAKQTSATATAYEDETVGTCVCHLASQKPIFSVLHSSVSGDGKRIVHGTEFNSLYTPQKGPWGKVPDTFLPATSGWVFVSGN